MSTILQARNRAIGRGQDACVGQILADEEFKPKTGSAQIKRVFSPDAEGIAVTANPEATVLTIQAPTSEPDGWDGKIRSGLQRFGKED